MATITSRLHSAALILSACVALSACSGRSSGNAAPRFTPVPVQLLSGTSDVVLDLDPYVTDREGDAITFTVVSGGGSFAASVYSRTFDTVGAYSVTVRAMDAPGKDNVTTFTVVVQDAELAVVQSGDDLQLMDTATLQFRGVASASGFTETVAGVLPKGHVVYERAVGSGNDLFVYNPHTTVNTTLGDTIENDESFGGFTSDNKVIFTRGNASETFLFIWDALTGATLTIANESNQHARDPLVTVNDLVFYELTGPGQGDIYYYDPASNSSTDVSIAATDENLEAVLPDGGAVFTRIGPGGERDLYYFRIGFGLVEIGGDLGATIGSQTKTYAGRTSDSKVIFEVSGTPDTDLYVWNPAIGSSRVVSATVGDDDSLAAVTALDEIVVDITTGAGNNDLSIYNYGTNTLSTVSADGDNDVFKGSLNNGDLVFLREDGTGDQLHLYDTSGASTSTIAASGGSDFAFDLVLDNDNVVYTRVTGGNEVFLYSGGGSSSVLAGAVTFAGAAAGGDFVIRIDAGGQDDLTLWDESAGTTVAFTTHAGNETFGFGLSDGRILFSRVETGETNLDLHIWDPTGPSVTRLTTTTEDHLIIQLVMADDS